MVTPMYILTPPTSFKLRQKYKLKESLHKTPTENQKKKKTT